MEIYNFIIQNKDFLKILYGLVITSICAIIVLKTDKLFRISLHQGIRYFRNAFLFFGAGFFVRYFLGASFLSSFVSEVYLVFVKIFLEFFLIMAGFFLLYSLIWKKIEGTNPAFSSLASPSVFVFYIFTIVILTLDFLWSTYLFMFFSQIFVFSSASVISLINFHRSQNKHEFPKFYFIAMAFSLIAWILNSFAALFFNWNYLIIIIVSSINVFIFLLFLYGVLKIIK